MMIKAMERIKFVVIIIFIICLVMIIGFNKESYEEYKEDVDAFVESATSIVKTSKEAILLVTDNEHVSEDEIVKYTSFMSGIVMSKLIILHVEAKNVEIPDDLPEKLAETLENAKQDLCDYIIYYCKSFEKLRELSNTGDMRYEEESIEWVKSAQEKYDSLVSYMEESINLVDGN